MFQISLQNKPLEFTQFLNGLGWIINPLHHPGFAGKLRPELTEGGLHTMGVVSAQIPLRPFPYYSNAIREMAFILPVQHPSSDDSVSSVRSLESSDSGPDTTSIQSDSVLSSSYPQTVPTWFATSGSGVSTSTAHAGSEGIKSVRSSTSQSTSSAAVTSGSAVALDVGGVDTPKRRTVPPQDCAGLVVWLECFEDHLNFPVESLSRVLHKGAVKSDNYSLPVVFVHQLSSGLYQITTRLGRYALIMLNLLIIII